MARLQLKLTWRVLMTNPGGSQEQILLTTLTTASLRRPGQLTVTGQSFNVTSPHTFLNIERDVRWGDHNPLRAAQPGAAHQVEGPQLWLVLWLRVSSLSGRHGVRNLCVSYQVSTLQGGTHPARISSAQTTLEMQVTFSKFLSPPSFIINCRFCNDPYDLEMIIEIIENAEKQLDEISKNPTVKLYEQFLRRNFQTLHIKHYLNLSGEILALQYNFNYFFSSKTYHRAIISWKSTN